VQNSRGASVLASSVTATHHCFEMDVLFGRVRGGWWAIPGAGEHLTPEGVLSRALGLCQPLDGDGVKQGFGNKGADLDVFGQFGAVGASLRTMIIVAPRSQPV